MTGILAEMGRSVADRWLNLLVPPGLLWLAALVVGLRLGHAHPFDVPLLRGWLDQVAASPSARSPATVVLAATGIVLASAVAGLAASAFGGALQRLWVMPGERPPSAWLVRWRRRRWDRATVRLKAAIAGAAASSPEPRAVRLAHAAQGRRTALGAARPERPTRVAERFHAAATRTRGVYGLDLDVVWPRLWAVLPDALRGDLTTARDAYDAAARLSAWGVLYALLAPVWWPAAPIAAVTLMTALHRARGSAGLLADLVETAVDLHVAELAERLGVPHDPALPRETGDAISRRLSAAEPVRP